MFISDLKPGTDYDIVVESRAKHQNQRNAWDPHDPYLCKEQGPVTTFRTGHPPMSPTEFSVIGGTTKSLKLAWNEPILRGVKILKYLLVVRGPAHQHHQNLDMTNTADSVFSNVSSKSKSAAGTKSKNKYIITNKTQNHVDIVPRVYEIPADTVIYEVKNLIERTEYQITLHMITPHSDAEKVKQMYDSPSFSTNHMTSTNTIEDDLWTPYVTTQGITAGIDSPEYLHVTSRDSNTLSFEWKAAKPYGMYKLLYYVIRWNEVEHEEPEYMTSRDKVIRGSRLA